MGFAFRLAGASLVMSACAYFAMHMSRTLERRKLELRKLYSILLQLKSEIRYLGEPLPDCFRKMAVHAGTPFAEWLSGLADRLQLWDGAQFDRVWLAGLSELRTRSAMTQEDIEPLKELADKLGITDAEAQIKAIDYALLHIERNRTVLESEIGQKKKVIATLSMFGGFMTLMLFL